MSSRSAWVSSGVLFPKQTNKRTNKWTRAGAYLVGTCYNSNTGGDRGAGVQSHSDLQIWTKANLTSMKVCYMRPCLKKKKSLLSHQQWRSVHLSPQPRQHLLSPEFLILAILTGVRWNLKVVLICISLMIKDFEHFFSASQPFGIPQLRILCLALYPIFNVVIWISGVQLLELFVYIGY
jgi:hypothetical protein